VQHVSRFTSPKQVVTGQFSARGASSSTMFRKHFYPRKQQQQPNTTSTTEITLSSPVLSESPRTRLLENVRKSPVQHQQQHGPYHLHNDTAGFALQVGTNKVFNCYIKNNKEQVRYPFYLVDRTGQIHCHCEGNPLAFIDKEKGWIKCGKLNRKNNKCCLFIPYAKLSS
jgi:hypothetical protein